MKGYIYKLYTDDLCYYGSSTMDIKERYWCHKSSYNSYIKNNTRKCESYKLFIKGNVEIIKIEEIDIIDKKDKKLKELEAKYIRDNICVNKYIPLRTHNEYVIDNYEAVSKYQKEYSINYRIKNEVKLKLYGKEQVICPSCLKTMNKSSFKYKHSKNCYFFIK
tara:strand:- start:29 stop:517 length:489 start_codon:yes stop_codon:yes gene_type:complete